MNDNRTIIQHDMTLRGALLTDGVVELHGVVEGGVCAKVVEIGPQATLKGDVVADSAVVNGYVEGRVTARQVRLAPGARVVGDLIHQRLSIEDGAEFEGQVLRKTDDSAWADIVQTFEIPGVELTDAASQAVAALSAEFDRLQKATPG